MGLKKKFLLQKKKRFSFFLEKQKIHKNGKMVLVFFNEKQKKTVGKKRDDKETVFFSDEGHANMMKVFPRQFPRFYDRVDGND